MDDGCNNPSNMFILGPDSLLSLNFVCNELIISADTQTHCHKFLSQQGIIKDVSSEM